MDIKIEIQKRQKSYFAFQHNCEVGNGNPSSIADRKLFWSHLAMTVCESMCYQQHYVIQMSQAEKINRIVRNETVTIENCERNKNWNATPLRSFYWNRRINHLPSDQIIMSEVNFWVRALTSFNPHKLFTNERSWNIFGVESVITWLCLLDKREAICHRFDVESSRNLGWEWNEIGKLVSLIMDLKI